LEEDAAIASPLAFALNLYGRGPFDVKLNVAKSIDGIDITAAGHGLHDILFDNPLGWSSVCCPPFGQALSIEQNHRIRWRG
jgi:hypothetical protein